MRLVLLGPPGAGKGTQAEVLASEYSIPHISTGDILREEVMEKSEIGIEAKSFMDKGALVPDVIVTKIVVKRISKNDAEKGFILDGYPRTRAQSESLTAALSEKGILIDKVLYFKTAVPTVISRLSGRRICSKCNSIYHATNHPPVKEGICDKCGTELYQRKDDHADTIKNRLEVYNQTVSNLLEYYRNKSILREVSGDMDVNELFCSLKEYFTKEGLA